MGYGYYTSQTWRWKCRIDCKLIPYQRNDEKLVITDSMSAGGNYNNTWSILDLTETRLRFTGVFLGANIIIDFNKE